MRAAGFTAQAVAGELSVGEDVRSDADRRVRNLGRRLVVAGLLFMPLCDASIGFSVVPSVRFSGWQWLLVAPGAPSRDLVRLALLRRSRSTGPHGLTTMDTLASIGILAATCWSVFAMFFLDTKDGSDSLSDVLYHHSGGALYLDVAAGVTTFLLAGRYCRGAVTPACHKRLEDALRPLAPRRSRSSTRMGSSACAR